MNKKEINKYEIIEDSDWNGRQFISANVEGKIETDQLAMC